MSTLNERLNSAIEAYARLAGITPQDYQGQEIIAALNESRDLDPSGAVGFLMLRGLVDSLLADTTFTAQYVFADPAGFGARLSAMQEVRDVFDDPDVSSVMRGAQEDCATLALSLGADVHTQPLADVLGNPGDLGLLRRDYLRSIEKLEVRQFTQGVAADGPLSVNRQIFEFWNINSLLRLLQQQYLPGATLCLIRDPEEVMASYFVFAVKNGDNITILTDRDAGPHPEYWKMSRRPDRALERRAAMHHFPYDLLELEPTYGRGGRRSGLKAANRTSLVAQQVEMAPLAKLQDLAPDELLWAGMILSFIADEYGVRNRQTAELSYTGEMVVVPEILVSRNSSLVHQRGHQLLVLEPLKRSDVTAEATVGQWRHAPVGENEWMIERHGEQVPEEILNTVGDESARDLERKNQKLLGKVARTGLERMSENRAELATLSPMMFGSQDEIVRDRLWVARVNQCRAVQRLADAEFERDQKGVMIWYRQQLAKRLDVFVEAAARGDFTLTMLVADSGFSRQAPEKRPHNGMRQIIPVKLDDLAGYYSDISLGEYDRASRFHYRCAVHKDKAAGVFSFFRPTTGDDLATLLGVGLAELPMGLQHWTTHHQYAGNPILERIDPSDWVLENPWNNLVLSFLLPLSKTAFNAARKAQGLPGAVSPGK